ncbi:MAG: hypothetical protein J3Q66DRAFT_353294 [Benniella sp.]|nr:MAG: hypothetical protein J3Q66DRAFT_353294 [Benniella sp.]
MPAGTKRQLETAQKPVSTRRRAKKAKLATATQAQKDGIVSSNKDRRRAAKSSKRIDMSPLYEPDEEDEEQDTLEGEEDLEEEEEEEESRTEKETFMSKQALRHESEDEDEDQDSDNDDLNKDDELIGKGKKGYRKKVKKPSGKKGKVFANTDTMMSIIDQVAGREENRVQAKQAQMGKIRSKLSEKEQKQVAKDKAKKALIEKKIEEIKRKKSEKRKVAKQRAGTEQKGNVPSGKKSVSFRV